MLPFPTLQICYKLLNVGSDCRLCWSFPPSYYIIQFVPRGIFRIHIVTTQTKTLM